MQCVAHELQTQATELMQPDNTTDDYNPSTRALGHIVGAAVAAVPQAVLEAHVCSTVCRDSVRHVEQWTAVMGCGLLTEKVQRTFHQLLECKEHARTSLVEVRRHSKPHRMFRSTNFAYLNLARASLILVHA